ncbi:ESPR domain-containing protein [Actinobacillus genomosp. 2]|uniref:ESPR domain-containing protein n=1 Tax=Actinobacillus genomosp. 2 TaxID=230709 RepID=UPI0024429CE3|nr:ESPR domain-containing protein [Actinobacillus genomosp. 2]WGE32310.1 ESPR domain-containing protein [Actinobacillus genomosp. 2]
MNNIFKVIWNHSTQSWVAVSELARGVVKSSTNSEVKSKQTIASKAKVLSTILLLSGASSSFAVTNQDFTDVNNLIQSYATTYANNFSARADKTVAPKLREQVSLSNTIAALAAQSANLTNLVNIICHLPIKLINLH